MRVQRCRLAHFLLPPLAVVGCARGGESPPAITGIEGDAPITFGAGGLAHLEPMIAVRPDDPAILYAGSIVAAPDSGRSTWTCAIFRSGDGGASWTRRQLDLEGCVDPWIAFPAPGVTLFTAMEILTAEEGPARLRLLLLRSTDGGRTWEAGPELGRGHDHQLLAVDRSGGPRNGAVYLTAQEAPPADDPRPGHLVPIFRSADGGATFERIAGLRLGDRPVRPTGLETLSDGVLVLTVHDRPADGSGAHRAWALASKDGGRTWSDRSLVTEACGRAPTVPGYPVLAVDASRGPARDRLYHVCVRSGLEGISVSRSDDAGRTWTAAARPDRPRGGRADTRSPGVAVSPDGVLGLAWYDRSADPEGGCQDILFSASLDGGETFLQPLRVSERTSCPDAGRNARLARSWPTGADYGTLTVGSDGVFRVAWADARSGIFQVRHAALSAGAP